MGFASSHAVSAIQLEPLLPVPAFARIENRPVCSCTCQTDLIEQASCRVGVPPESLAAGLEAQELAWAQQHTATRLSIA